MISFFVAVDFLGQKMSSGFRFLIDQRDVSMVGIYLNAFINASKRIYCILITNLQSRTPY